MIQADYTFLNATGTPGLSLSASKQMRAHITRTNFAKLRERKAISKPAQEISKRTTASREVPRQVPRTKLSRCDVAVGLPRATQLRDPYGSPQSLSKLWSLLFMHGRDYPVSPDEAAWIGLHISEPALIESAMAVGARYWSPDAPYQQQAEAHLSEATDVIIQRIDSGQASSDAVLMAVFTMAFGERLRHDEVAWNIHIDGLAKLINERRSQGASDLPQTAYDLLLLDSINDVLGFPRMYHAKIIDAVRGYGYHPLLEVATICTHLVQLRKSIKTYRKYQLGPEFVDEEIETPYNKLLHKARLLRLDGSQSIQATSIAIKLILLLSWPSGIKTDLTAIAASLKEALCPFRIRPCSYMDLTSCQLMIGAIASDRDSLTREWFVAKLRRAVTTLRTRGWDDPLRILERGFLSDSDLTTRFRALWKELDC